MPPGGSYDVSPCGVDPVSRQILLSGGKVEQMGHVMRSGAHTDRAIVAAG